MHNCDGSDRLTSLALNQSRDQKSKIMKQMTTPIQARPEEEEGERTGLVRDVGSPMSARRRLVTPLSTDTSAGSKTENIRV